MNKIACLLALILSLVSFDAWAWDPPTAPNPPQSYIADVAHKLSPHDLNSLNTQIRLVNRSSRNEIAILILPTLGEEAMSDVANATFKAWKVGKKDLDNGVLIVIALKERKARIEVGKGIEGDLTDSQSSLIIREKIFPHWKKGNLSAGLAAAVDEISHTVESRKDAGSPVPTPPPVKSATPSVPHNPNTPAQPSGCSYSAGSTSESGIPMFTLLILALVAYVAYRIIKYLASTPRYEDDFIPPPPVYTPPPRAYTPPTPAPRYVEHHDYVPYTPPTPHVHTYTPVYAPPPPPVHTYTPAPVYVPPPPPPPVYERETPVTSTFGAVTGAAVVSSLFDSDPEPTPSYSTPSYDPPPSYSPPSSSNDDVGFSGGDSGGGGAEESWSDSSSDSSSDSGSYDSGSSDSSSSDD